MSIPITINGTIINFPSSGQDPNWAPAVIQFAEEVANALAFTVGPFNVPPQVYIMVANSNSNVTLPNLSFPPSNVQGAVITYSVFRTTTATTVSETGELFINFNPTSPVNSKWEISRDYVGDAQVTFSVLDVGQLQFSSALLAGLNHTGTIVYQATAILKG